MFDLNPFTYTPTTLPRRGRYDRGVEFYAAAVRRYHSLQLSARIGTWIARLLRKPYRLLSLNEARADSRLVGSYDAGVRTVPVKQITGSEDRVSDFDPDFRPRCDASRERWAGIYAARLAGVPMPAVHLVQIGNLYFVRDGHHRVSVARFMKEEFIDAEVTVWELAPEPALGRQAAPVAGQMGAEPWNITTTSSRAAVAQG